MTPKEEKRILVVDDEESLLAVLSQILEKSGYVVTTAVSGEIAWELFTAGSFPLVIADIVLPGLNGIELLQRIKQLRPDTQVIIMTSYASFDTVSQALHYGAYDYLMKPFEDLGLISAAVKRAMDTANSIVDNQRTIDHMKDKIAELEHANQTLRNLQIRDGLTGLFNFRFFQEDLAYEMLRSGREKRIFSMLFVSVDQFRSFCSMFGRTEGDKILLTVGQILKRNLRKTDLLARYRDEIFAVLLPETSKANAQKVAQNLCARITESGAAAGDRPDDCRLTVSVGIATFPIDGKDGSSLIKKVGQSLQHAVEHAAGFPGRPRGVH